MGRDSKPLKVDILTPIRFGGPQKWGDDLVRALKNEGIEARNIHSLFGVLKRFFYTDADIIHTTLPLAFNLQGKSIILTIHGDLNREKKFYSFMWDWTIKRAKKITVPSQFLKNKLNLKREVTVIPNGIFLEDYKPVKKIKKDFVQIVTVTGFKFWDKARGVIELLKILEDVKKETKKKFKFVVVGDGPYLERIKRESKKYDVHVEFIGFHPNPKEVLFQSDIFVYYSFQDTFGIAILEAMACGLPVITNDLEPFKEIIPDNKDICLPQSTNTLIKMVNSFSYRKNFSSISKKNIQNYFIAKKIYRKFKFLYNKNG